MGNTIFSIKNELIEKWKDEKNLSEFLKPEIYSTKDGLAYKYADYLKKRMNTAQIRNIFSTIKEFELENRGVKNKEDFKSEKKYILLTQVAYAVGRKVVPRDFYDFMEFCVERIQNSDDLKTFVNFFEAIIAYHKFLGGGN